MLVHSSKSLYRKESLRRRGSLYRPRVAIANFRRLVRMVIDNYFWISEIEGNTISYNVVAMKNVGIILRRRKGTHYFTLQVKAMLFKRPEWRTPEENQIIEKVIDTVNFIRKYPVNVQKELCAVTTFAYFGPNRLLIRQNHDPQGVYFIISGIVMATRELADKYDNPHVKEKQHFRFKAGDIIGEASLLTGVKRMLTFKTLEHCEFLYIKREDYVPIVSKYAMSRFQAVEEVMSHFKYFRNLDDYAVKDMGIVGQIQVFPRNAEVCSDKIGKFSTFFVLEGECRLLEYLLVYKVSDGIKGFKYKFFTFEQEKRYKERASQMSGINRVATDSGELGLASVIMDRKAQFRRMYVATSSEGFIKSGTLDMTNYDAELKMALRRNSAAVSQRKSLEEIFMKKSNIAHMKQNTFKKYNFARTNVLNDLPMNVETYLMEVCTYRRDAVFGVGEDMHRRRVLAKTDAKILIVPKYILVRHQDDILDGLLSFFNLTIPNSLQVFEHFQRGRRFREYRRNLAMAIPQGQSNNHLYNVPYSIRIRHDTSLTN